MKLASSSVFPPSSNRRPTDSLLRFLRARDWDAARMRLLTHPSDAFYYTDDGKTPLHMICLYQQQAPPELVELLLATNPSALYVQDGSGWTPLHWAILYQGNGSNNDGFLLRLLQRGGRPLAAIPTGKDGKGASPLYLACLHGSSLNVLRALLELHPELATSLGSTNVKQHHSTLPAHAIWNHYLKTALPSTIVDWFRRQGHPFLPPDSKSLRDNTLSLASLGSSPSFQDLLARMKLLVQAAKMTARTLYHRHENSISETTTNCLEDLLRDVIRFQPVLGDLTHFLQLTVALFPHVATHTFPDDGSTLLHHLMTSGTATVDDRPLLEALLQCHPEAAALEHVPTRSWALHLALHAQRSWNRGGVATIARAYTDALEVRDARTQLYPFQLAAAAAASETRREPPHGNETLADVASREEDDLSTVYELLLVCPHVVSCEQKC